jgi:hypothetical protein
MAEVQRQLITEFPLPGEDGSFCLTFKPSTDWMRPPACGEQSALLY